MLTSHHHQVYQTFLQALQSLAAHLEQPERSKESLQEDFAVVQQVFEQNVIILRATDLDDQTASRWQSVQTELHRTMRLLQMDRMRWQVARQPETAQRRRTQVRDRVNQLIQYCQTLLQM
jgi:hypothetical protein